MQQILRNLANILLLDFCKASGIDTSGTHTIKRGRGFTFSLVDSETGKREIAGITFHKMQVPTYRKGQE